MSCYSIDLRQKRLTFRPVTDETFSSLEPSSLARPRQCWAFASAPAFGVLYCAQQAHFDEGQSPKVQIARWFASSSDNGSHPLREVENGT
jgi:hypothetical protein